MISTDDPSSFADASADLMQRGVFPSNINCKGSKFPLSEEATHTVICLLSSPPIILTSLLPSTSVVPVAHSCLVERVEPSFLLGGQPRKFSLQIFHRSQTVASVRVVRIQYIVNVLGGEPGSAHAHIHTIQQTVAITVTSQPTLSVGQRAHLFAHRGVLTSCDTAHVF